MIKVKGYEKAWNLLFGAGMATAVTTLVLWGLSTVAAGIPAPPPEMVVAAVTGVIFTLFNAAQVYITGNSPVIAEPGIEENTEGN